MADRQSVQAKLLRPSLPTSSRRGWVDQSGSSACLHQAGAAIEKRQPEGRRARIIGVCRLLPSAGVRWSSTGRCGGCSATSPIARVVLLAPGEGGLGFSGDSPCGRCCLLRAPPLAGRSARRPPTRTPLRVPLVDQNGDGLPDLCTVIASGSDRYLWANMGQSPDTNGYTPRRPQRRKHSYLLEQRQQHRLKAS